MGLKLTILGCAGSHPGPSAACSGYLLQTEKSNILIDAGPGTFANLQNVIDPHDLTAVFLSHEHPDHWSDLDGLAVFGAYNSKPMSGLPVYAPAGLRDNSYYAKSSSAGQVFKWNECEPGQSVSVDEGVVSFRKAAHPVQTLAMCFELEDRTIGYTADTGPEFSLSEFGKHFDWALIEATDTKDFESGFANLHLSGRQAATMAKESSVDRAVLTHIRPSCDRVALRIEASEVYENVILAEEGMVIEL